VDSARKRGAVVGEMVDGAAAHSPLDRRANAARSQTGGAMGADVPQRRTALLVPEP
jgi:hypothetical protein